MAGQPGLFDLDERYAALSSAGDPLERLTMVLDFELFRGELGRGAGPLGPGQGRPPGVRCGDDVQGAAADALHPLGRPNAS